MCLIGASMGGAIVSMFAVKYPDRVHMICLLAPPGESHEVRTDADDRYRRVSQRAVRN